MNLEDGLSSDIVYHCLKDEKGLIWIGTHNGIDRYDGNEVKHYVLTQFEGRSEAVYRLYKDKEGTLWAASGNGAYYYKPDKDKFETFNPSQLQGRVYSFCQDRKSMMWIGTAQGLFVLKSDADSLEWKQNSPFNNAIVHTIFEDQAGTVWVGSDVGTYKYKTATDRWLSISEVYSLNEAVGISFFEDNQGRIWIGSLANGLFVVDPRNRKVDHLQQDVLPAGAIRSIQEWAEGNIALCIDGGGLVILNQDLSLKDHFVQNEDQTGSLSDNGVYHLFKDEQNRYWISTYGGGMNIYNPNRPDFRFLKHETNNLNSLNNNYVRAILKDKDGVLWFGTEKGISSFKSPLKRWEHYFNQPGQPKALSGNTVLSLCEGNNGQIWIGTYAGGVTVLDENRKTQQVFRHKADDPSSLGTDYVYSIYKDLKGRIWIGGIRGNLSQYLPASASFKQVDLPNVFAMIALSSGELLLGTASGGIFRMDQHGKISPMKIPGLENEAPIICFHKSPSNQIWMGTEGNGLFVFNEKGQNPRQYRMQDGLPSNRIVGILADQQNRIWLSTSHGLSCFQVAENTFWNYDIGDGLGHLEFNRNAFGVAADGQFIFGGKNGITLFYPEEVNTIENDVPRVFFTAFKLGNKVVDINESESPLSQQIDDVAFMELTHRQNAFSFEFMGINYDNALKNKYQWRLVGLEEAWTPPSSDRSAIYTNISPGDYLFELKVSADGQNWSPVRTISLHIKSPLWLSGWAFLLYILVGLGLVILAFTYVQIRIKERNAKEKVDFFINVAHDLRTPLTLIKAPLQDLKEEANLSDTAQRNLALLGKNADRLEQLMTQILDFQRAGLGKMQLLVREKNIIPYLREKIILFRPLASEKNIELTFVTQDEELLLYYDTDKIDKIIYNLLSNAIKYTPEGGNITLKVERAKDQCQISISDTGIGIPPQHQKQIFNRYSRAKNAVNHQIPGSGIGLMLTQELVKLHKGKIELSSELGIGTEVIIYFPFGKAHLESQHFYIEKEALPPSHISITTSKELTSEKPPLQALTYSILIVEDNLDIKQYLIANLSKSYHMLYAEDGKLGIEIAKEKQPDLIISDVRMPVMDGNELCRQIKDNLETSHIPVILLTALKTVDSHVVGISSGADVYLEKPFELKVLQAYIKNLIEIRQSLKEIFISQDELPQKQAYPNPADHAFIEEIRSIVNENLASEDFSVDQLSKEMGMSRPVIFRKLKGLTGQNIQNFIKIVRLQKAKELLFNHNMTVAEVAYKTGYNNPKYFSVSFKKHFGYSPSEVKK